MVFHSIATGAPTAGDLAVVAVGAFWAGLVVAAFSRAAVAIVRGKPLKALETVAAPVLRAAAVESRLYGWPPGTDAIRTEISASPEPDGEEPRGRE